MSISLCALLGRREIAALDAGVELAVAAEQVVDDQEHQIRVDDEQRGAAQRLDLHEIQIGRHHQIADEFAVFQRAYRADCDLRAATDEVEEPDAQQARETLVDQFERGHAPAHDALLRGDVVGAYVGFVAPPFGFVSFAADAFEQVVNFFL